MFKYVILLLEKELIISFSTAFLKPWFISRLIAVECCSVSNIPQSIFMLKSFKYNQLKIEG